QRVTDPNVGGPLLLPPPRLWSARPLHAPQQARARADVPGAVTVLVQRRAVASGLSLAGHAVDQDDVRGDVVFDVVADVVLDRRVAVDVGADLGEDLVPGPADLLVEVAAQRPEVLVEPLGVIPPARLDPLPCRRAVVPVAAQPAAVALRPAPGAALLAGALHDHLRHIRTH